MTTVWKTKALGDVCRFIDYRGKTPEKTADGIRLITAKNVKMGFLQMKPLEFVSRSIYDSWMTRGIPKKGDVLFTTEAPLANIAQLDTDESVVFAQRIIILQPVEPSLDCTFLKYLLLSEVVQQRIHAKGTGATVKGIKASILKTVEIVFPPLPEQHRIVAILDEAFDGIATAKANAEKNLQNARALFESHVQTVFSQRGDGWEEAKLSDLCFIKHGFAFKSEFFAAEGDFVLLTPGNFYESGGYRDRGEKQKYYVGEIPRDYVLNEGDLLVAMTEQAAGLLGSSILVPETGKFLHNQRLGLVTKKDDAPWINEFFFHVFNTQSVRKEIHASASGVKVRHTSPSKIGEVVVGFPTSMDEQRSIVSTLVELNEEIQRFESIYQEKIALLDELKKSLLHQAFSGNL
jgi:type I restriction enzyme S subunit